MASAPPDGTAEGRSNGKRRKHAGKCRRYAGEYRKTPGTRRKISGNKGRTSGKSGCRKSGNAGEGGREMPGNRVKSNQPQSILRLIFHISRDKGTRSGNSLSHPVRRIAATAGTIKKAGSRITNPQCGSRERRETSGHKKSGRPRLFGLPQAGMLLKSGSC